MKKKMKITKILNRVSPQTFEDMRTAYIDPREIKGLIEQRVQTYTKEKVQSVCEVIGDGFSFNVAFTVEEMNEMIDKFIEDQDKQSAMQQLY